MSSSPNGVRAGSWLSLALCSIACLVTAAVLLPLRVMGVQVRANETTSLVVELEDTPNFLERVQVTATKTELSIGDVAAQADIVDRSTIDGRGHQSRVQAAAHVPRVGGGT